MDSMTRRAHSSICSSQWKQVALANPTNQHTNSTQLNSRKPMRLSPSPVNPELPATPERPFEGMDPDHPPAKKSCMHTMLRSLTFWIVLGSIVGIVLGQFAPEFSKKAAPMAQFFLRPIQFIVFPLVFSSLLVGIAGQKDLKQLGRLSIKSFLYFECITTIALFLGLFAVNIAKPGNVGITQKGDYEEDNKSDFGFAHWVDHLTPKTWGEMMGGSGSSELLQVLVAAILTGVSTSQLPPEHKVVILTMAKAVMEMMFKFVDIIIWTAPIGVCFAIANAIGKNGMSALSSLGALVATFYTTLLVFIMIVFVPIMMLVKIRPLEFVSAMREPLIIAYTTATSEAALPAAFESLEKFGVATHISAFVIPFGYSFNLDGSTLYQSLAVVFCAQAADVHKSFGEQIVMVLMLMISSKGVAGVRSASIIVLASTVNQFNIPSWPVALILGADWFMDMARTFVNLFGNLLAAVVMAKMEGEFRKEGWEQELHDAPDEFEEKMSISSNA